MRRLIPWMLALAVVALGLWLWAFGGSADLGRWATENQRVAQDAMALALTRLRAGDPGALATLLGLCFAYGFFHAAGPGHGKILIGGYGLGRQVAALRLSGLALAASLAQAATAVVLVYAGVAVLNLTRQGMTDFADQVMAPASYGAIALVGVWLALRGVRRWRRLSRAAVGAGHDHGHGHHHDDHDHHHHHNHDHDHDHHHHHDHAADGTCATCGHRHGPTLEETEAVKSWKDAAMLIGAVAIRPCTGALFLLILTWRFDLVGAGIAGAFAMGLGTASITIAVAIVAVTLRSGVLARLVQGNGTGAARAMTLIEIAAGCLIAAISIQLLLRAV